MTKQPSRPARWAEAVKACQEARDAIEAGVTRLEDAVVNLRSVQEEYEEWKDNLDGKFEGSPLSEKLEEVCNIQTEDLAEGVRNAIDEASGTIDEAEGIDLPRGFGRD